MTEANPRRAGLVLAALAVANVMIWAMIAYETRSYGEGRRQVRRPEATTAT